MDRNAVLLDRARRSIAGGDSSSMRVLHYHPPFVAQRGAGCRVWDANEKEYIDFNMGYGPLLFGHRPKFVLDAVIEQISQRGSMLGFPQTLNFEVGEKIQRLFPSMELMRFANSGTEAVASAVRLARAYTGKKGIVLFEGHYHGWNDATFNRYHAPLEALPSEPGDAVLSGTKGMVGAPYDAWIARFNDIESVNACFARHAGDVAAVIMEPVMSNAGVVPPVPGFLEQVKEIARRYGALLIFDEVITGLRLAPGGAQQRYEIRPDLTVLSKALGGGFPVAAFGGSSEIMDLIVRGEVFHGGVYSGNAAVLSAANAVLGRVISDGQAAYDELERIAQMLSDGIRSSLKRYDLPFVVQNVGSIISIFATDDSGVKITSYRDARRHCDFEGFIRLQHLLLKRGLYIHPNQFEPLYLSFAHRPIDIERSIELIDAALGDFVPKAVMTA